MFLRADLRPAPSRERSRPDVGRPTRADAGRENHRRDWVPAPRMTPERVTLIAADGYRLGAMRYTAQTEPRAHLIVAGAIGVAQRFYRRFAEYAAASGFATLTLDYRGIGESAPSTLRDFRMDYFDWGRLDLAAAVDVMSTPARPLYIVGHSYAGHAFGVLPDVEKVAAFCTFGTGAGWHGWMPPVERLKVLALWHVVGPLLTRKHGYLPLSSLGIGEDLPVDFYRQWKRWCRYPNYCFGDPSRRDLMPSFGRVRVPLMAINATDDRWSPPRSRDAFITHYANARRHTLDIEPAQVGAGSLGHMGYFKPEAMPLWEFALAWLEEGRDYASWAKSTWSGNFHM